jgi:hypothetical protein
MKKLYQRVVRSPSCKSGQLQWQTDIWVVSEIVCGLDVWGRILARIRISLIFRLTCVLTLTPIQRVLASLLPGSITVWWLALLLHVQDLLGLNDCMKMSGQGWRIVIACNNPSREYLKTSSGCVFPDNFNLLPFDFMHYITHVVYKTTVMSKSCKLSDQ